ncbi:MAG TPA: DUF4012 domain-containing protein [Candidatus Portnoybacteria bacterium]|nr:DUF4012 domain-containing protein [Candidatus Portnoybacteria bacterium]
MAHKGTNSQGDFGVKKGQHDLADLALSKNNKKVNFFGRIIDLSKIKPGVFLADNKPAGKKRGRKKSLDLKEKNIIEQKIEALRKPIEIAQPKCDDLIAILAEIEAIDESLKNQIWRLETNNLDEPILIIERAKQELLDAEDLVEGDLEELLWLKEKEASLLAERDVLETLLSELAVDDFYEEQRAEVLPFRAEEETKLENDFPEEAVLVPSAEEEGLEALDEKITFEQSEFLSRWRQSVSQPKTASLIPFSRKTLGTKRPEERHGFWSFFWRDHVKPLTRRSAGFLTAGSLIFLVIFGMSLAGQGLLAKENILSSALQAYKSILAAKDSASNLNFSAASVNFETAYQNFLSADQELNKMGRGIIYILEKLPGGSVVGSGAALVDAGENFAKAGQSFAQIANIFLVEKFGEYFSDSGPSFTQKIVEAQNEIGQAQNALAAAGKSLSEVNASDLPADLAPQVASLQEKMAPLLEAAGQLQNWSNIFLEVLGHERAKKYLLVFQNNSEARPTGGFIGTYGLVDLDEGRLKNLFIDGIFNLDGQLYEKITPPKPIQKISTAWSTHDANWFADFPTSARKIMSFYEKAGGQTVDGVISLTPTVVERLLALTGPIDLPQYGVSLNKDNFLDLTQYKVEVDYDKELNQPKKILADFAPLFLDRLWQVWPQQGKEIIGVLADSLAEKHVLFYFSSESLEKTFVEQGWAGEIMATEKDYFSVINTNINGFKTDKVLEQKIYHSANVQADGSVIDTVRIVRTHNGGQSQYDWYNKVNSNYLRVYVPLGSKLLSAQGQTLEAYSAPIDYQAQGFKADPEVAAQEQGTTIDQGSGTQIFQESGKTVFGNWVFVSPGESVEITYKYLLPFKIDFSRDSESYSLLAQKQSGSAGSDFESVLHLPQQAKITWQYPASLTNDGGQIKFSDNLKTDKFYGLVFGK